nr:sugar nucleotide-binding protein [Deinobacterium chartae]
MTGGSGRLGTELQALLPGLDAPSSRELDLTDAKATLEAVQRRAPQLIVHAAAYTDVRGAEANRERCWAVNVEGTRAIARAANAVGARLIHISTDYVFEGNRGGYREDDPLGPPVNYYALTKLVAEEAARAAQRHLIVRTSFRPREWPYPTAFTDMYTSQDYVDVIAPLIAQVIRLEADAGFDTLHVATERKSIYELASRRRPDVKPASRAEAGVNLPEDVSLDVSRFHAWQRRVQEPRG